MVVVLGGVGQLAGTVYAAMGLGIANKFLEAWSGAVLAKIALLVFIIVFIQKRPQGLFALKGQDGGWVRDLDECTLAAAHCRPVPPHADVAAAAAADARRLGDVHCRRVRAARAGAGAEPAPARGHPFHLADYWVTLGGKIMCYAIVALAMDLIWGYAGILSLGHGLFFALGGYAMGMYLMRSIGHEGVYRSDLPDFMVFLDWKAYPWYWSFTDHFWFAALLVVLVPGILAFVFGYFAFRSRIKGVYFSIITQALTYAFMLLFFRNDTGFGGNNGFTDFKRILGYPIAAPGRAWRSSLPLGPRCSALCS
jgi:ABC-type branched-subunit amino acid transport system permease subunit